MRLFLPWSLCAGFVLACGSSGGSNATSTDAGSSPPAADSGGITPPTIDASLPPSSDGGLDASSNASFDASEDAPLPDGSLLVQFVTSDESVNFDPSQEEDSTGTNAFGVANAAASDGIVATLTRKGGEAALTPSGAEEIVSREAFSFGTFRYRFNLASCQSSEELVNGVFTYFNDGTKAADGNVINREVDIEILCGEPYLINLTIWTEYTSDTQMKNQSRVLDTRTGTLNVFADDSEGNQTGTESHPELMIPNWPAPNTFYEMGFTWTPTSLTYYLVNEGTTLTLWEATDATRIPQLPMEQHFNVWAPGDHWSTGVKASPPANDATLSLDWFEYVPM